MTNGTFLTKNPPVEIIGAQTSGLYDIRVPTQGSLECVVPQQMKRFRVRNLP